MCWLDKINFDNIFDNAFLPHFKIQDIQPILKKYSYKWNIYTCIMYLLVQLCNCRIENLPSTTVPFQGIWAKIYVIYLRTLQYPRFPKNWK